MMNRSPLPLTLPPGFKLLGTQVLTTWGEPILIVTQIDKLYLVHRITANGSAMPLATLPLPGVNAVLRFFEGREDLRWSVIRTPLLRMINSWLVESVAKAVREDS